MNTTCKILLRGTQIADIWWDGDALAYNARAVIKSPDLTSVIKLVEHVAGKKVDVMFRQAATMLNQYPDPHIGVYILAVAGIRYLKSSSHLQYNPGSETFYWFGCGSPCHSDRSSVTTFMVACLVILLEHKQQGHYEADDPSFEFDLPDGTSVAFTRYGVTDTRESRIEKKDVTNELIL
jgi:hypothetical protein